MSLPAFDLIANLFYSAIGDNLLMLAMISFFIILVLVVMKADLTVILMVMAPLLIGLILNTVSSNFIAKPSAWIFIVVLMLMAFSFVGLFYWLMR